MTREEILSMNQEYIKAFPLFDAVDSFLWGIYQTNLNTLGTISLAKGSKELNINLGERLWYDSRYNCTDCDYKLRRMI